MIQRQKYKIILSKMCRIKKIYQRCFESIRKYITMIRELTILYTIKAKGILFVVEIVYQNLVKKTYQRTGKLLVFALKTSLFRSL